MEFYTFEQAKIYKHKFTQTEQKYCKKRVQRLLAVNNEKRTSSNIGQWFASPSQVPNFNKLTRQTILLIMYEAFTTINYNKKKEEAENCFKKLLFF